MRTHHRDEERESAAGPRRTVRRPEQNPGAARLLGLQESVGNDAVTESLRRSGHPGAAHGAPVQRASKRDHEESTQGGIDPVAVSMLGGELGRTKAWEDKGGQSHKLPKDHKEGACWEWAVRAASDGGGLSHEECWNYLISNGESSKLNQIAPAVKQQLDQLRSQITAAGLQYDPFKIDEKHPEETLGPLMRQATEGFVRAHGLQVTEPANAAGWVVCNYKTTGRIAVPDHFWIELPDPKTGQRVVLQTVPGMDHIEAGGPELRWHEKDSVKERQSEHTEHKKIEIPVAALKGQHTQIINSILERGRRTRSKAGPA
ncbi:hypothetical protein ABZY14_19805 [Streptomyces sp. NPDC006617]|uniref:hypothetical protein n=1 Tax=Streptomyces sp. NPDC006617 TaxID=3155354 RepID=UPI0033A8F840